MQDETTTYMLDENTSGVFQCFGSSQSNTACIKPDLCQTSKEKAGLVNAVSLSVVVCCPFFNHFEKGHNIIDLCIFMLFVF